MANRYDQFSYDPPTAKNVVVDLLNGQMSNELDEEDVPIGHDHNPLLPGRGGPIKASSIATVPAGDLLSTNQAATNAELNVLANLGRIHVPERQTVLHGLIAIDTGTPIFLTTTSGLTVNISATTTPLVVAFAYNFDSTYGQLDYIGTISADVASAWPSLPANQTCYLYVDRNIETGALSYGYSLFAPAYQNLAPETPSTDQHWFDLNSFYMKRWSGTTWENKQRVFVGECTTDADSVTSVTTYAIQGKSTVDSAPLASDQLQTIPHNIGRTPTKRDVSLVCISDDHGWAVNDEIILNPNYLSGVIRRFTVGVDSKNITIIIEAGGILSHNKSTKAAADLTLSKWKFRIRCEA